jgi:hydrogenase expression/formation protein HypC
MCLAIPGKVVEVYEDHGLRMGRVDFGGTVRRACLEHVPEAGLGDYVLVHVGFALSRVDPEEAARTYALLEELGQLGELDAPEDPAGQPEAPPLAPLDAPDPS